MSLIYSYKDDEIRCKHILNMQPKQSDFKMHTHDYAEVCLFLRGKGIFHVEGTEYNVDEGDILLMRRAEAHYIEIDSSMPYERFALHFRESLLSGIDRSGILMRPFTDRDSGQLNLYKKTEFDEQTYNTLVKKLLENTEQKRLNIISNLIQLMLEIKPLFDKQRSVKNINSNSVVYRILNDINSNLYKQISLDELCEKHYISKSQLCRVFKKATGSTVWDYITSKRLLSAREMLGTGIAPKKVCKSCGFGDYSSFYRAYSKRFGESPKQHNNRK